ncbi:hypothetical protein CgunFtcFv8_015041 [Champsocephalus gunnari]|uniref:Endonuclease/exonuclease/phosphatase domain-containing protein n=1 Tax=Champsocephalus gunnari TaxID=52237 RepID=A0AAN8E790_CHAGU|nr:hypothetical protein CgunFtcFv8_015041 [Champsocephalus gunnari]
MGFFNSWCFCRTSHSCPLTQKQPLLLGHHLDFTQQKVKMKIAAFNVQRLGWDKVNKKDVRDIIIKIMSQYSVVVLVEVTDKIGGDAMGLLLKHLNDYGQPFVVLLKCRNTVVEDLVLIPVQTKPSNAEAELNALHDVVEDVRERWQNDNIVILGDFNADRPYLSMEEKETLLISLAPYHWLIGDEVNTMTRNNNYTYDRIVVYGESMLEAIVPDSAKAYNFREHLNLTEEEVRLMFRGIVVVQDLVLIPVHTKPSNAEAELNALHDVVEDVRKRWKNDNIMILGDFNADRPHLSMEEKKTLPIFLAPYHSLIGDDVKHHDL